VNVEKNDVPARTPDQPLTPVDGAIVAALVAAMTAASVAGAREAMYGCFAAAGAWLLARLARQEKQAKTEKPAAPKAAATEKPKGAQGLLWAIQATPVGYRLGLTGLAVAFFGLGGDIVWHTVFGVEDGIARVIAPFHLFLFTGAGLLLTSPLRASIASPRYQGKLSFHEALPIVLGLTLITALALFLFQWLSPFADWSPSVNVAALPRAVRTDPAVVQNLQMVVLSRIILGALILVSAQLVAVRRFHLPFGAMTVVYTVAATLTGALTNLRLWGGVLAAMVAGFVADALIAKFDPSAENTPAARLIAFATGLVFAGAYLTFIGIFHQRTYPIDLAMGTVGLTGIACLTLSAVALAPAGPEKYATSDEDDEVEETAVVPAPAIAVAPAAMPMPLPPMPAPAPVPAARPRPVDPAILRLANKVAGTAATRERPIETTVLCQLLRGASVAEVAAMYEPALDTADVDELVTETDGAYASWAAESLENSDVVYLYLEAIPTNSADDLLAAWGVTRHGRRVLLGLRAGDPERATAWGALGVDLVERGMPAPALVIADGAPGVWRTVSELWPEAAQQQSLMHALAEAAEGLSDRDARELRNGFAAALEGARSADEATGKLEEIVESLRDEAPARMAVLARRIERMTAHLDFPTEHHRRIRSADALQRGLSEVGIDASVPLVWTVINRNTEGARRMAMSLHAAARIDQLRRRPAPVHNHEASEIEA
jgi:putative transposase